MANRSAPLYTTLYSEDELNYFKELLEEEHQETKEEIETLREQVDNLMTSQDDEQSGAAHHQDDIGSEEDEREKFLIMIKKQNEKIKEINASLDCISLGTYSICKETGQKFKKATGSYSACPLLC